MQVKKMSLNESVQLFVEDWMKKSKLEESPNLIGKEVTITSKDSWAYGEWGVIKDYDGEYYYVAIADDPTSQLVFDRKEFKIKKGKN